MGECDRWCLRRMGVVHRPFFGVCMWARASVLVLLLLLFVVVVVVLPVLLMPLIVVKMADGTLLPGRPFECMPPCVGRSTVRARVVGASFTRTPPPCLATSFFACRWPACPLAGMLKRSPESFWSATSTLSRAGRRRASRRVYIWPLLARGGRLVCHGGAPS